jgi:hypothetical protein
MHVYILLRGRRDSNQDPLGNVHNLRPRERGRHQNVAGAEQRASRMSRRQVAQPRSAAAIAGT